MGRPRLRSSWSLASERGPNVRALSVESDVSDTLAVLAATWGVVMAISPALQIRRILQRQSSDDVSIGYLGVLLFGFCLWIAYGFSINNAALIVPNLVALAVGLVTVVVARRYRTDRREAEPVVTD
jgi:MtN3 and saliva related transmembrane protein